MAKKKSDNAQKKPSKDEQIGFHKGSLATLTKEREELLRIVAIVEQIMQMHMSELKTLGVDFEQEVEKEQIKPKGTDKPIDELL